MALPLQILNRIVSKMKGETFILDSKIPVSYLFCFFSHKVFCAIIGFFKMRRFRVAFISPSARIRCPQKIRCGKNLNIGSNCCIDPLSQNGVVFGDNCSCGAYTNIACTGNLKTLGKGLKVGNNCGLGTRGHYGCAGGVEIGDDTIIGDYVSFHSENHNFDDPNIPIRLQGVNHKGIKVGNDCWIGAKATILDGAVIPDHCIVAAGAVVTGGSKFEPYSIIGGIPARVIKMRPF